MYANCEWWQLRYYYQKIVKLDKQEYCTFKLLYIFELQFACQMQLYKQIS